MAKIEVKINGVNTLVDVDKLEKLENGLFADNYNEDWTIDKVALGLELEADRVKAIKAKAGTLILSKYSIEKQSSANLGIYGQEYLDTMKAYIADVIKQSNELEADVSKTADDFVVSNIGDK